MKPRFILFAALLLAFSGGVWILFSHWRPQREGGTAAPPVAGAAAPNQTAPPAQGGGTRAGLHFDEELRIGTPAYQRRRALVVGVGRYSRVGSLGGVPAADAAEVAAVLASRFGFEVELFTDAEPSSTLLLPPDRVHKTVLREGVTGTEFRTRLGRLPAQTGPQDALLFYFAGHGVRREDRGYLVPADGNPDRPETMLDLADVAGWLRACDAHHTLLLLDCCFSGVALEPGSGVEQAVLDIGTLDDRYLAAGGGDNLARVFSRRAFQVITAGTGREAVDNEARPSTAYADLARNQPEFQGHSPFTAVLLQALRGRTGRPDGVLQASALGYFLSETLVNIEVLRDVRQVPRYGALGRGEGDFLFQPVHPVLNPRLVAPLYLPGPRYAELRRSACEALAASVLEGVPPGVLPAALRLAGGAAGTNPGAALRAMVETAALLRAEERRGLARAAVPHLAGLLETDRQREPQLAAARALADLAAAYGGEVAEFAPTVRLLAARLRAGADEADLQREAARALSKLGAHLGGGEASLAVTLLGPPAAGGLPAALAGLGAYEQRPVRLFAHYVDRLEDGWQKEARRIEEQLRLGPVQRLRLPAELQAELDRLPTPIRPPVGTSDAAELAYQEARRRRLERLTPQAVEPYLQLHERGKAFLERARQLVAEGRVIDAKLTAARAVGFVNYGKPQSDPAFAQEYAPLLWPDTSESQAVEELIAAPPSPTLLWSSPVPAYHWSSLRLPVLDGAAAWSPDGRTLAATSGGEIRLWDPASGKRRKTLVPANGTAQPRKLAWAPGGHTLAAGGECGTVWLWNTDTAGEVKELRPPGAKARPVISLAWLPDGRTLAAAHQDVVRLWDTETGRERTVFPLTQNAVGYTEVLIAWSPDGRTFASSTRAEGVRLWETAAGTVLKQLQPPDKSWGVNVLAWSPDGRTLAVGGGERGQGNSDSSIRLWDVASNQELTGGLLPVRVEGSLADLAWSPRGQFLAWTRVGHEGIQIWDVASQKIVKELRTVAGGGGNLWGLAWSPDGRTLAGFDLVDLVVDGRKKHLLRLWNVSSGLEITPPLVHTANITALAWSPDGRTLASGGQDQTLILWDVVGGMRVKHALRQHDTVFSASWSPDGRTLAVGGPRGVSLWDVGGEKEPRKRTLTGVTGEVFALAWSPDGRTLAAGGKNGVRLWDVRTGTEAKGLPPPRFKARPVVTLAWSPDGQTVAAGVWDGLLDPESGVLLWNVNPGRQAKEPRFLQGKDGPLPALAWSPDGRILATVGQVGGVFLSEPVTGKLQRQLDSHQRFIKPLAWSPDGRTLAVGGDGEVLLWDPKTGRRSARITTAITGQAGTIWSPEVLAWSPDGRVLATADGADMKLWDVSNGSELKTLYPLADKLTALPLLAWSPEGRTLAFGIRIGGGRAQLWERDSGWKSKELGPPIDETVRAWAWSPDGRTLALGERNRVRLCTAGEEVAELHLPLSVDRVFALAWSPDGRTLAAGGLFDIYLWDSPLLKGPNQPRLLGITQARSKVSRTFDIGGVRLAWSPDGRTLAASLVDGVRLWDPATGAERKELHPAGESWNPEVLAWSPDGRTLAGGAAESVWLWNPTSGESRQLRIPPPTEPDRKPTSPTSLAWSPDGLFLAAGGAANPVLVWEAETGRLGVRLPVQGIAVWLPDGRTLATAGHNGIQTWCVRPLFQATPFLGRFAFRDLDFLWPRESLNQDRFTKVVGALASPDDNLLRPTSSFSHTDSSSVLFNRRDDPAGELSHALFLSYLEAGNLAGARLLLTELTGRADHAALRRRLQEQEAEAWCRRCWDVSEAAHASSGTLQVVQKDFGTLMEEARAWLAKVRELSPTSSEVDYLSARLLLLSHSSAEKGTSLSTSKRETETQKRLKGEILALLAKAVERGFSDWKRLEEDPVFALLRSEARFRQIVEAATPPGDLLDQAKSVLRADPDHAVRLAERVLAKTPKDQGVKQVLGQARLERASSSLDKGLLDSAAEDLKDAAALLAAEPLVHYHLARLHALRAVSHPDTPEGRKARAADVERALDALEAAAQQRFAAWNRAKTDKALQPIHDHPRFKKLLPPTPSPRR